MTLWRAGHVEGAAHPKNLAPVVEEVHLVGNEIATCGPVPNEGIIVPTVPEPAHHFRELDRTVVALAVFVVLGTPEIPGFRLVGRGDHIPTGSAMADVVERGKFACHIVGLVVTGGGGRYQADPLGDGGNGR